MPRFNVRSAYERESEEPFFSRSSTDPLASWRISGIKGPLFEQWYFDSVSNDSGETFSLAFARDASYAMLLRGHFRMEFEASFADGTNFSNADWMGEAALEDTTIDEGPSGEVRGIWTGDKGKRYSFTIAGDGSFARAEFSGPRVNGTIELRSEAPAHYPSGVIHADAGTKTPTELCPKINLVEVIPHGTLHADLVLDGRPMKFSGIGGHMHVWAEASWFDSVRGWRVVRGRTGDYGVTLMQWSSILDNQTYSSGFVTYKGKKAFGGLEQRDIEQKSDSDDGQSKGTVVRWKPLHGVAGGQPGPHHDRSNGALLTFKLASEDNEYQFKVVYRALAFAVSFGGGLSGLASFSARISGGRVSEDNEADLDSGPAYVNVCDLPQGWTKAYFFLCMILTTLSFGYINILGTNT